MNEGYPSLEVYRPVTDSDRWYGCLSERLGQVSTFEPKDVSNTIHSAIKPKATIIAAHEIVRLYKSFGKEATAEELRDLSDHLRTALPATAWQAEDKVSMDLRVFKSGKKASEKILVINPTQRVLKERATAQNAVRDFYGIGSFDRKVWGNSERTAGIRLARSDRLTRARIVDFTKAVIGSEGLLPLQFELAEANIETKQPKLLKASR